MRGRKRSLKPTAEYLALNKDDDLVFNDTSQSYTFPSLKALKAAIDDELDEPQSWDFEGNMSTERTDGGTPADYRVFVRLTGAK